MPKYSVFGTTTVCVYITVEADSEEEAVENAYGEVYSLNAYCGNGGTDKIIGVSGYEQSVSAEDGIKWESACLCESEDEDG